MNDQKNLEFQKLTLDDLEELIEISRKTYFETFSWGNSEENMLAYLNQAFSKEQLTSELIDVNSEFYFARLNDLICGYLKISFGSSQNAFREENGMELVRIYVNRECQGEGIGNQMLSKAIKIARERRMTSIWLGVWEKNEKALSFYKKNSFNIVGKHSFIMGDEEQQDYLMKREIMSKYRDQGAVGALLDEYERALEELKRVIQDLSQTELTMIVDNQTDDEDCKSIQTILSHVVKAGYGYVVSVRKWLNEDVQYKPNVLLDSIESYNKALDEMFLYNAELFQDYPKIQLEEHDASNKILVSWGQLYDVEQIFEHAIVHILRHRRQIERFIKRLRSNTT